jgi:hypothetical protein
MNFRKTLLVISFTLACGLNSAAQAGQDTTDFINQVNSNFQSIAVFMNGPFVNSLGFFTSLGWDSTPTVYDLASGPHFSVNVGAGADFIGLPNTNNLSLPFISASSTLNFPTGIPLPYPVINARLGLFNGFDVGFRYTYLPPISVSGVAGNFNGWGLDLRYKLFEGAALPTVTLSTSFDSMTGSFSVNTASFNESGINYTDPNSNDNYPNASLTGNSNYTLNWNTQTVGAKVTVGKSLGILYPFAGIGFQRNSGTVTSTFGGNFTANLNGGAETPTQFTSNQMSAGAPVVLEPTYTLGLKFGAGLGFEWLFLGESNGTDIAGTTTLGLQF